MIEDCLGITTMPSCTEMSKLCKIGILESDLCVYNYSMWLSGLGAVRLIPGLRWITLNQSFNLSVSWRPFSTFWGLPRPRVGLRKSVVSFLEMQSLAFLCVLLDKAEREVMRAWKCLKFHLGLEHEETLDVEWVLSQECIT